MRLSSKKENRVTLIKKKKPIINVWFWDTLMLVPKFALNFTFAKMFARRLISHLVAIARCLSVEHRSKSIPPTSWTAWLKKIWDSS